MQTPTVKHLCDDKNSVVKPNLHPHVYNMVHFDYCNVWLASFA